MSESLAALSRWCSSTAERRRRRDPRDRRSRHQAAARRQPFQLALAAALLAASVAQAQCADLKIVDIKAYVFLERAGRLSDDLVGGEPLVNTPRGGALGGDTATAVMVDLVFEGDKKAPDATKSAPPKPAIATVDLTQTNFAGQRIVTHKVFADLDFGAGINHKVVFLEKAPPACRWSSMSTPANRRRPRASGSSAIRSRRRKNNRGRGRA